MQLIENGTNDLIAELSGLIERTQIKVVNYANSSLTLLFWQVGKRINEEILGNQRAEYGKQIVSAVSTQLETKYGRNFTEKNVRRMIQFSQSFENYEIVVSLSRQLTWSHFLVLIPLKTYEMRLFYANTVEQNALSVRGLRKQIETKVFERTQIANLQVQQSNLLPLNTFKDPYLLDFLGLNNGYLEKDLENAILKEMHKDSIMVAEYWTDFPPKAELEKKLHQAYIEAKNRFESQHLIEEN